MFRQIILWVCLCVWPMVSSNLTHIDNEFIQVFVGQEGFDYGRFSIETTGGDPTRSTDDGKPLIYGRPSPWTSYTTISVNGTYYGFGTPTLKRSGKGLRYGLVTDTIIENDAIHISSVIASLNVQQTLSFVQNPLTNVYDSVLIEYLVVNSDSRPQSVGLRIMMDTMLGNNDAAPFRIGPSAIVSEASFSGADIHDYWQTFDSLDNPTIVAQGLLRYPLANVVPPDQLILMNWGTLADQPYLVDVQPGRSFIRDGETEPDTALALLWNETVLQPNESRVYRTIMGLGGVSLQAGDVSLGLSAPKVLSITDPNDYLIVAYLTNTGGFSIMNATASLKLPTGIRLIQGNKLTELGTILSNESRQIVYKVSLDPTKLTTSKKKIHFSIESSTLADQSIVREIQFTGQPQLSIMPVNHPSITRGFDEFVDVSVRIKNTSIVPISNIHATMSVMDPLQVPVFESSNRTIKSLLPNESIDLNWMVGINDWQHGTHNATVVVHSDLTPMQSLPVPIDVILGQPRAALYYSQPRYPLNTYGYLWVTVLNMPKVPSTTFRLVWDDTYIHPIRFSTNASFINDGYLPESVMVTGNTMIIPSIELKEPVWRRIIGSFHFKVIHPGTSVVEIWSEGKLLDTIDVIGYDDSIFEIKEEEN